MMELADGKPTLDREGYAMELPRRYDGQERYAIDCLQVDGSA